MPDLLPDDFGTETLQPPVLLLREQAEHLGRRTGGLVLASVRSQRSARGSGFPSVPYGASPGPGVPTGPGGWQSGTGYPDFIHRFVLEVPTLDDYNFTLFIVTHPLLLYPLNLMLDLPDAPAVKPITNPSEFEEALRAVFAHPEVWRIINALKSQAMAAVAAAG